MLTPRGGGQIWALRYQGRRRRRTGRGVRALLGISANTVDVERLVAVARTGQVGVGQLCSDGRELTLGAHPAGPRLPAIYSDWVFQVSVVDAFRRHVSVLDHVPRADLKQSASACELSREAARAEENAQQRYRPGAVQPFCPPGRLCTVNCFCRLCPRTLTSLRPGFPPPLGQGEGQRGAAPGLLCMTVTVLTHQQRSRRRVQV